VGQHMYCDFFSFSFVLLIFFNRATALHVNRFLAQKMRSGVRKTLFGMKNEPIFAHLSPKDAVWCKEDPFWDEKCVVGDFTLKTPLKWVGMGN